MKLEFLTEAEFDCLNQTLMKYGNDDSVLDVSELDGFLTAVVSGPNLIPPSQWFTVLWGGSGFEPEWESESEAQRFMALIMQHMNCIAQLLTHQPEDYEALFNERVLDGQRFLITDEWCEGYMRGIGLDEAGWAQTPPELLKEHMAAINMFAGEFDEDLSKLSDAAIAKLQARIEPAARALHGYWLTQRSPVPANTAPVVHISAKVGRNERCPCGSGKKYKQCCLH